ncbi:MAG: AraC family transcriptional regulator [Hahellaceae bacterium]|jgi:AraC-like DNA-binding protein|nr:AraC family transcriptional regulator [Hahellaceae bacterium]
MQLGDISIRFIDLMFKTVEGLSTAPQEMLRRFNIPMTLLSTPDARISIGKFMVIGHALIQETDRPELGLLMGKNIHITHFGLPGYAVMTAPKLETALALCVHFEKLASENRRGSSRFYKEGDYGIAEFYSISPYNDYNYFVVDCILSGWLTLAQWLTRTSPLLDHVQIEFDEPAYSSFYRQIFGCPVRFRQPRNALVFKPKALELGVAYAQPASHQAALTLCNQALLAIRASMPIEDKVRQLLMAQPQLTTTQVDRVAEQLGLSPWTLQRQLKNRRTSVSLIADDIRREMALTYLTRTTLTVSEIAFELGYRTQPSFFRAFKRWVGMSPERYRQREEGQG